jgi:DNA-binding FrmR family transcriptional regulator
VDVLTQVAAVTSAMKKTGMIIMGVHMQKCINEAAADPNKTLNDFQQALSRYIGLA